MLDFNSTTTFSARFEALIDAGLQARGFDPVDDNHADALGLLDWAMAQGGVA